MLVPAFSCNTSNIFVTQSGKPYKIICSNDFTCSFNNSMLNEYTELVGFSLLCVLWSLKSKWIISLLENLYLGQPKTILFPILDGFYWFSYGGKRAKMYTCSYLCTWSRCLHTRNYRYTCNPHRCLHTWLTYHDTCQYLMCTRRYLENK